MAKEICISSTPHETRLAILEDDQLAEIYYERENEYTLAGSVYNGRVTRVLPGMQSAFVDIGLERDAFLYVTDFLELEDQEETDELEKAAATGINQPPREVRHTGGQERSQERAQKPAGGRQQREPRGAEGISEPQEAVDLLPQSAVIAEQPGGLEESGAPGAKRWRGRRRRRGNRGETAPSGQVESPELIEAGSDQIDQPEPEFAPEMSAASAPAHATRFEASPTPFVLPGESLSKYGGAPAERLMIEEVAAPVSEDPHRARPVSTFKPPTLIETPIEWDGIGLFPGESISKHRNRAVEPVLDAEVEPASPAASEFAEELPVESQLNTTLVESSSSSEDLTEAEELSEETIHASAEELPEVFPVGEEELVSKWTRASLSSEALEEAEDELMEEELVPAPPELSEGEATLEEPLQAEIEESPTIAPVEEAAPIEPQLRPEATADETVVDAVPAAPEAVAHVEPEAESAAEPEPDASASHDVDSLPPVGFRLFGLGGKKKVEEKPPVPEAPVAPPPRVSTYAPGNGVIEEELIEEEEFEAPQHIHAKADLHDQEDFEEETLPQQMRTGDLGEMLQEAHLDHRIQLNFDGKTDEDEDEDLDEDEEGEDEPTAEGQPSGEAQGQPRRDRFGRGRRPGRPGGPAQGGRGRGMSRRTAQTSDLPIISDLLKPGQEILVQIAKEPIAKKGARITSHIALPGRFLVFMPTVSHVGVSRKIASDEERQRLKRILVHERGEASGGFIVRTAAEGASEEELRADLRFLLHLWAEIKQRSDSSKSPALIYHDLSLIERILRDQVSTNFSNIWVDSEADYERIVRFLNRFSPTLVRRVKLYTKETPLFEHFGIQDEISKALRSKVWLKSGGSIVINQTEALVAIDINTGKYVGKSARLEDTILKTNLDAVPEIVRQIRLRDLGGIIVIDFIDMDERKNRFKVMAALEEALKSDRAPTKVLQFNDFGLVAITRKRVKQSLERTLSVPCSTCQATGMVKSPTTVCNEIYTELRKMRKHFEGADVMLRVNPETVKVLKQNNAAWMTEFEELIGKNILIKSDPALHPEQFDIQG